jgi:hypothetical protein
MPFITQGKTNVKYLAIVLVVAVLAGVGIFLYQQHVDKKSSEIFTQNQQQKETTVKDKTVDWQTYQNKEGGYLFKYPKEWSAETNKYNSKNALFGPGATSESGYGGIEFSGTLLVGQSLKDFVKEFNKGLESGSISETEATVSGRVIVISILPKAATEPTETKSVSFEKDGKVFNMYLMYKTDFTKYPDDEKRLTIFNQMLSTFKFIEQETADRQTYRNEEYGLTLTLSQDWQGYSATTTSIEYGWKVIIRHPQWTEANPYEDIPILVYPIEQWEKWEANNFEDYPTAAPFGPSERGCNAKYVFATAPRYNYDYRAGWEEVENIIKTLKTF